MATNITNQPSKMQTRLDAAASGLSSINLTTLNSMMILGAMMAKAEVITKLKSLSAVYAAATNARCSRPRSRCGRRGSSRRWPSTTRW